MSIVNFFQRHRRKILGTLFAFMAPGLLIGGMLVISKSGESPKAMKVAAIALNDYYSDNPPFGVWNYEGVRITEEEKLIVDVHVAVIPHATFIKTRNKRIKYSYLKLACPKNSPELHRYLEGQVVWINMHFHGETLLLGACPLSTKGAVYTS